MRLELSSAARALLARDGSLRAHVTIGGGETSVAATLTIRRRGK